MRIGSNTVIQSLLQNAELNAVLARVPHDGEMFMGGLVHLDLDADTTTGTSEEAIKSFTLDANSLNRNGSGFLVVASGVTATTANNKTQIIEFGSTDLVTTGALAANNKDWFLWALLFRTGVATQISAGGGQANEAIVLHQNVSPTEDETAALDLKLEVTDATAAAGTTCNLFAVWAW